ncbi:MAG TPA: hypothetical protein PKZ08_16295, partial [Vicinamibacterales bacterium]|nr:hypothetical protein [Vicinamibacterales bacterium]
MSYGDGHCGGCGSTLVFDTATGTYVASYDYPLDSRCLRDNWRRDSSGAYPCTCQAEIFYGDDSLADYFTEDITPDNPRAIGTILFGGIPVWSGEATHHVADDCHDPFSDGCDGCSSGCADGNCDDLEGDDLGSLAFRIPLGMPREGQVSGFLWFKAEEPFLVTPAIFNLLIRDDANVVAVTNNGLRHVTCSDVRGRTAVIDDIPGGVRITLSKTADNSLEHTWIITNSTSSVVHIKKISRLNNVMRDVTYTYVPEDEWATPPSWTRRDNIAQSSEQVTREDGLNDPHTGYLQETRVVRDAAGAILSHDVTGSRRFGVGQKAVLREVYHATLGLQSNGELGLIYDSASYWTDDDHPRRNGRPRLVWGESRPWSYQAWDDEGREILRLDQYDGSDAPTQLAEFAAPSELADLTAFPAISAIATVSAYAPLPGDSNAPADIDAVRTESRHLVRGGAATLIGRTWRIHTHGTDTVGRATVTVQTIRAGSQTAALDLPAPQSTASRQAGDSGNAVSTHTRFDSDADGIPLLLRDRPVTSTDEDGITTTYDYVFGDYDSSSRVFTPGG